MTLKEIADFFASVGVILGVPFALYSLDAWRREARWKRRAELCEEVLALCYETRDIISYMRHTGGSANEWDSLPNPPKEPDDEHRPKNAAWIPIERYNEHREKLSHLWALSYRFRAHFGEQDAQPIADLRDIIMTIKTAAYTRSSAFWREFNWDTMPPEEKENLKALRRKFENVIWEGESTRGLAKGNEGSESDEIQRSADDAVKRMERTCRGVLEAQHTLFGLIKGGASRAARDAAPGIH